MGRWKQVHELLTPSLLRERVSLIFDHTDLAGCGVYDKSSGEDTQTRYDVVNNWQANYVRGRCELDGTLVSGSLERYDDDALFRDFYSRRPSSRVLDVGCNTGKNLTRAKRYGGLGTDVWGLEYSQGSALIAKSTHGADRIFQGDASQDFVLAHGWKQNFTALQCTAVLQHMSPQQVSVAIRNMARCLRPHGEILLTFKDAPTTEQMRELGIGDWSPGVFTADLADRNQYLREGYLRAVMWDDDYYPGVASLSPPVGRNASLPGLHRREFFFYSLGWMKAVAEDNGLCLKDVEVHQDSKIPFSALHWKVILRAGSTNEAW